MKYLLATTSLALALALSLEPSALLSAAPAFQGRIRAIATQGSETTPLLYTVGTNQLRIEVTATNRPHPVDLVDLSSDALTLVFPHNRSFVRLKPAAPNAAEPPPGLPAGIGPQPQTPGGSAMPMMPLSAEKMELQATSQRTNMLGRACKRFELKQRGETLEIWATDQLIPFRAYQRNQAPRFGPRRLEEQWPGLLQEQALFPLRVSLRFDNGAERFRLEVQSIQAEPIADPEGRLFQPPPDYYEIEPLPF